MSTKEAGCQALKRWLHASALYRQNTLSFSLRENTRAATRQTEIPAAGMAPFPL